MNKTPHKFIKIIYISSAEFGISALRKIAADARFKILGVITLPDKPKNRGMKTEYSAIKKTALDLGIKVLEAGNMRSPEFLGEVKRLKSDLMVMASFGKIVPAEFLKIPPYGVLNIHPSLLPKFRGPSPIQSAILSDEEKTGVTIILTDEKMDHGPILKIFNFQSRRRTNSLRDRFSIFNLRYKELHDKLAELGAELICEVIPDWVSGKIRIEPQNDTKATYTKKITKEDGLINWNEPAEIIERKIRAYEARPTAYFFTPYLLKNKKNIYTKNEILKKGERLIKKNDIMLRVQVLESDIIASEGTEVFGENSGRETGDFFEINRDLAIQTGNGILKLLKVKPEGKKEMSGKDFLLGYKKYLIKN